MTDRIIEAGTLVDGASPEPHHDVAVRVADGRVAEIGERGAIVGDEGTAHVEHDVVVPGFIDAHCHVAGLRSLDPTAFVTGDDATNAVRAAADCRDLVAAGFTGVRDLGSSVGLGVRAAIEEGTVPGPRVYTSGRAISQTGGHGDTHSVDVDIVRSASSISRLADGEAECRKAAREAIREGVDVLKIMTTGGVLSERDDPAHSQFTDAEIAAMVEEAHRVGIPVASHAQGAAGIKAALRNGVDTIEHGFFLDEECIDLFFETGGLFVPTLAIMRRIQRDGAEFGLPEWALEKNREAAEAHLAATRRAYEAGVPIAAGTDFIGPDLVPHGENAEEMELLVEEVGMTEMEALQAGTRVAARTCGVDDVGTVEPGQRADLVALGADPLDDISAVYDVERVYRDGAPVDV